MAAVAANLGDSIMRTALFLTAALLLAGQLYAADVKWETDLKTAIETAAKDKKDVLLIIGGSPNSESLEAILSDTAFTTEGEGLFVFAHVKDATTVAALCKSAGVDQDPTLMLLDSKGRPFGVVPGFIPAKSADYISALKIFVESRQKRDILLAAAEQSEGIKKATLLHAAMIEMINAGLFQNGEYYGYDDVVKQIVTIDADNKGQLKSKWSYYTLVFSVQKKFAAQDIKGIVSDISVYVSDYKETDVAFAQKALFLQATVFNQIGDVTAMIETIKQMKALDPNSELGKAATAALEEYDRQIKQKQEQAQPAPEPQK
jgi:hypothetical protein